MKDDTAMPTIKGKTCNLRLTLAREFASEAMFNQAAEEPQTLAAMMFGDTLSSKIIRTRGAIAYAEEVTCIITVPELRLKMFTSGLEARPVKGAFVMQQGITVPAK